jgi:hypothetical protein
MTSPPYDPAKILYRRTANVKQSVSTLHFHSHRSPSRRKFCSQTPKPSVLSPLTRRCLLDCSSAKRVGWRIGGVYGCSTPPDSTPWIKLAQQKYRRTAKVKRVNVSYACHLRSPNFWLQRLIQASPAPLRVAPLLDPITRPFIAKRKHPQFWRHATSKD